MKKEDLYRAINEIDDSYIIDAQRFPGRKPPTVRWIVIRCAIVLLVVAIILFVPKYKRIRFNNEGVLGDSPKYIDVKTEVIFTETEEFPVKIPIYHIFERNITNEELEEMKRELGIPDSADIDLHGHELSGYLTSVTDTSRGYFTMTDEELEKVAWETFKKLPFMDGEYQYLGIVSKTEISDNTGTHVTRVGVSFRRILDGMRVLGAEYCVLSFDDAGLVEFDISLYDYKKLGTMDVVPLNVASAKITDPDRFVFSSKDTTQPFGVADTMRVNDVILLLMNQYNNGCTILQPVYSFMGDATDSKGDQAEFNVWVIAIPKYYTYEDPFDR